MNKLVTIKAFTFSHEVAIVRGRLEAEGIYCFVQDELMVQVQPFASIALGGVKLQVHEEDAEHAIALLKEYGDLSDADLRPSPFLVKLSRLLSKIPFLNKIYQ